VPKKDLRKDIAKEVLRSEFQRLAPVCVALLILVFVVFGRATSFPFVNYDDDRYVTENPVVQQGLTWKGFTWAFTYGQIGHWHPLTWLTHMADCQIYGLRAGGHHLTNVLLHAAAVVLLFLVLQRLTDALWRSAFVAAVFAIHPLRVESVVWIAERKDVLSGVFFMLTLLAYARYVRRPSPWGYIATALVFALGLLSKNTLVTLPFVLLLLDWWPLDRVKSVGYGKLILEKIPLFLLSTGSCIATALVPETVAQDARLTLIERLENAVVSYAIYLRQMVFPMGLATPYPDVRHGWPLWQVGLSVLGLAAISAVVFVCRKKRPYLVVGWLWYLGMLVPMIGIVQISYYSHADRYTYLPGIGVLVAVTWAVADWSASWKNRGPILGMLMGGVIIAVSVVASIQTGYWASSEVLWTHALACTTDNYLASYNFGNILYRQERFDEAIPHFEDAIRFKPNYADAHINLGTVLARQGKLDEAITHFRAALGINAALTEAHFDLAKALQQEGKLDEAIAEYHAVAQINPGDYDIHNILARLYVGQGKMGEAAAEFQAAVAVNPNDAEACNNLGSIFARQGKMTEAIAEFQQALKIRPDYGVAQNNLNHALQQAGH
jgi:Tfp pilus assembly protein PilF